MASFEWPPTGSGGGVPIYSTFSAFPSGSTAGDLAVAADTGILYEWNGSSWQVIAGPGTALSVGAFGSTPNADGLSLSSNVLTMQPADATHPGGVSTSAQTFEGVKTFNSGAIVDNGSVSAPGLGLSSSTNSGIYLSGTNKLGVAVNGVQVLDTVKSTSGFGNLGMGGSASTSDSYPLLIQRDIASAGVYGQISNTDTAASSKATWQLSADAGNNNGEVSLFTSATTTPAYANAMAVRPSASTAMLSLIGGDLSTGYVTTFTGGDYTATGETARFNADHTMQFIQSVTSPTTPSSGTLKFYNNAGVFTSKNSSATVSSFTGTNTGDQTITLTSDVTGSGSGSIATTVAAIAGNTVSGTTGTTNVVFSSAPTLSNPVVGTQSISDNSTKAASTAYVTTAIANAVAGINPAVAVNAATTSASDTSSFTYNNGVSGIGATFTGTVNTAITIGGYTFTTLGQRLLVKNDTQSPSGAFNGVYYVTQVQTSLLAPILTRALDYDTPSDINNTGAIPVITGTTSWLLTSSVTTVGTSPLTYTQFTYNPTSFLLVANNLSDVASKTTSFNNLSPMTTGGDLIYGGASGAGTRLANGNAGQVLTSAGSTSAPTWSTPATNSYYNGSLQLSSSNSWSWSSGTLGAGTVSGGSSTLTTRSSSGITVTAQSSNGMGITFTPAASSSIYWVSVSFMYGESAGAASGAFQLTDGSVVVCNASTDTFVNTAGYANITVAGVYVPGTASAITLKIYGAISSGSMSAGYGSGSASFWTGVEWQIFQIK